MADRMTLILELGAMAKQAERRGDNPSAATLRATVELLVHDQPIVAAEESRLADEGRRAEARREADRERKRLERLRNRPQESSGHDGIQRTPADSADVPQGFPTPLPNSETTLAAANADAECATALQLAVWSNQAVSERWGEQPSPYTAGGAAAIDATLRRVGVPGDVAKASIYRQCRASGAAKPPNGPSYFEPGILEDFERAVMRRTLADTPPQQPPPSARSPVLRRPSRRDPAPSPHGPPAPPSEPGTVKWQT